MADKKDAKGTVSNKPTEKPAAKAKTKATPTAEKPKQASDAKKETISKSTAKPTTASVPTEKTSAAKPTAKPAPAEKQKATKPAAESASAKSGKSASPAKKDDKIAASVREEKAEKPAKQPKQTNEKVSADNGGNGGIAALWANKRVRIIGISVLSFLAILALVLGLVLGLKGCNGNFDEPWRNDVDFYDAVSYKTNTIVGFTGEVLGTTDRVKPVAETKNGGLEAYPEYGKTLGSVLGDSAEQQAKRNALIYESSYLTATGTWNGGAGDYTWMDKDGFLFKGTTAEPVKTVDAQGVQRQLYKHTAAVGLYGGNVADNEPALVKKVTMRPRTYLRGYGVTGLYAPAGEVIKIEMSKADMDATGGVVIHIGQALYNGKANNIWTAKNQMQRFPVILNTMNVTKDTSVFDEATNTYTAYVGSFIGGPIYIRNESVTFSATISGGVRYSHFILGYTTEKEFEEDAKSSAPYFDLEVWDRGVLHSGPRRQVNGLTYTDLYKAAVLWDKVASVTTTGSNQGIVFLYDPFVAAGAAVAFPGQGSVNCPEGWMRGSLNYTSLVNSGSWGNFHEYHHNFQGYGVGNGGEVTNNGMTLVSYALFTKISANRGMSNYGAGSLGGWNAYTCATWAMNDVLKIARENEAPSNGNQGLALYATLLHNFGPDNYILAKVAGGGQSYAAYMNAWQNVTHNNMYYYFNDVLHGSGISNNADPSYPMFVPVSSVYQTGRSYLYDGEKKYFKTMQPYVIPYGEDFTVDLRKYVANGGQYSEGSIMLPDGFTYAVKNVSQPENGKISETGTQGVYTYTPDGKAMRSGEIKVTLSITKNDGAFTVDDVDLVLEFEQSHETNKTKLQRTTYTYAADKMYSDAQTAFEKGFADYTNKETQDHSNPVQNVNTDIWFYPNTDANHTSHPDAPDHFFARDNTIDVIDGKLYFESDGKYRVYLRGRLNCAVAFSLNGNDYTIGATIKDTTAPAGSANFRPNDSNTYFDVEYAEGTVTVTTYTGGEEKTSTYHLTKKNGEFENWLYVKEILIVQNYGGSCSFIGLGMRQWTQTMFTMHEAYYDAQNKVVESAESEGYAYTETTYNDLNGHPVAVVVNRKDGTVQYLKIENNTRVASTQEEVSALTQSRLIAPTGAAYVNAYRSTYEFATGEFETDYYYVRSYNYNYVDNSLLAGEEIHVVAEQCANLNLHTGWGGNDLSVAVDGITDQGGKMQLHTSGSVSEANPFTLAVDLGGVFTANRLILFSQPGRADPCFAKDLILYASVDGEVYEKVQEYTDLTYSGSSQIMNFQPTEMRYYKIVVSKATSGHLIIRELQMWHINEVNGGTLYTPDNDMFNYEGAWHGKQVASMFGHVRVGEKGAKMKFEFEGTRIGFLSSSALEQNFEVYIDGKKVDSIALKEDGGATVMAYLCDALTKGKHTVEVRCTGVANIDSVVVYP